MLTRPGSRGKYTRPRLPEAIAIRSGRSSAPVTGAADSPPVGPSSTTPPDDCERSAVRARLPETPLAWVSSERKAFVWPHSSTRPLASWTVAPPPMRSRTTSPSVLP